MSPGVSSWIPGPWSVIVTIGHAIIMRSVVLSFEMFTGSVIDIFFSQKESLLAVTHFTIEGKVCCWK